VDNGLFYVIGFGLIALALSAPLDALADGISSAAGKVGRRGKGGEQ
jgi:hypothetical protein